MLVELRVRDLGVISDVHVHLGTGMTALTGETGAGKTLVVTAIELLSGGRADPAMVRHGATQATVEGRFEVGPDTEHVLTRTVAAEGRSRATIDGRMCTVAELAHLGTRLIDLHGQNTHQGLLSATAQRHALDAYAGIDPGPMAEAAAAVVRIEAALADLGGDAGERARDCELLRYQVEEIAAAALENPAEDASLLAEEELLASAVSQREAAEAALAVLSGDGGAVDALASSLAHLGGAPSLGALADRLHAMVADATETASDLRQAAEAIEEDPERLAAIQVRRRLLSDLRRKYGPDLGAVMAHHDRARARLAELEGAEGQAQVLQHQHEAARRHLEDVAASVRAAREASADPLAREVEGHFADLAMAKARLEVVVRGPGPGGDRAGTVELSLAANPGSPPLPLGKVASGGELARVMLALRLALGSGGEPGDATGPTLVFDEVDAGIGGETALAVGRYLARLADATPGAGVRRRQVLVVTHLAQVAAFADAHLAVEKGASTTESAVPTVSTVRNVAGPDRLVELARMLSGQPENAEAQRHAQTLLDLAGEDRSR